MAQPENTAYQIQACFQAPITLDGTLIHPESIVGISPNCIRQGTLRSGMTYRRQQGLIKFTAVEDGYVSWGFNKANKLLTTTRKEAKSQFKKGVRPTFFLRKLTMSEFMSHSQFSVYKDTPVVKALYKKYLLMDLLK